MKQKQPKRARPDLEWPWCETCGEHVRETNGIRHECIGVQLAQMEFAWPAYTSPEQPHGGAQ